MSQDREQKVSGRQSVSPSQPSKASSFHRIAPLREGLHCNLATGFEIINPSLLFPFFYSSSEGLLLFSKECYSINIVNKACDLELYSFIKVPAVDLCKDPLSKQVIISS